MAYTTAGVPESSYLFFNSGFLDFGNNRVVNLDSCKIDYSVSEASFYVLNSIKKAAHARHSLTVTITGKTKSFQPAIDALFFGSSSNDATTTMYSVLDGQPTAQNPVLTVYDQNNKEYQYQIYGALLTRYGISANQEAYSEWDFTLDCLDIQLVTPLNA
jgi:hypothetical protein